jgi:hypothetical protein
MATNALEMKAHELPGRPGDVLSEFGLSSEGFPFAE